MPRLLVVEDNPTIRDSLADLFVFEGYEVAVAENGREACVQVESDTPPDVIVLDLMMPVMDGWQFLDWWTHGPFAMIPVVVLTALNLDRDVTALAGRYCVDVLPKTGSIDALLERARALCASR